MRSGNFPKFMDTAENTTKRKLNFTGYFIERNKFTRSTFQGEILGKKTRRNNILRK